jgi:hypothetical protein
MATSEKRVTDIFEALESILVHARCGENGLEVMGPTENQESPEGRDLLDRLRKEYDADPELVGGIIGRQSDGSFGYR